jgi:coproporphyrinogen III oxidase-like Fe-S oxidoreductase
MNEWIGYGPSACTQYQGVRRKNIANLEEWAEGVKLGNQPKFMEEETLSYTEFAQDAVLFGLRMNQGISMTKIAEQFDIPIDQFSAMAKFLDRLVLENLATQPSSGSYALTKQGRILCDAIACDLPELGSAS